MAVHTPYNFVPFSNTIFERYKKAKDLPEHNVIYPDLHSGEIYVTFTADTPVFISDGIKDNPHFIRNARGECILLGSSVRGMVRENMQILGYGQLCVNEDVADETIFFRDMISSKYSIGKSIRSYYTGKSGLDVEPRPELDRYGKPVKGKNGKDKVYSVPQKVKPGYLYCENGKYYIKPTNGSYIRVAKDHEIFRELGTAPARYERVSYKENAPGSDPIVLKGTVDGMKHGVLLFTGAMRSQKHLYIFPEVDASAKMIEISEEDWKLYVSDREKYKNQLDDKNTGNKASFWELPKDGESKPVFYIEKLNEHTYFGMSLFLRITYPHSIAEGLPEAHREKTSLILDYPHAILGYAFEQSAYRSRVSFGDCKAVGAVKEMADFQTVLNEPKPSFYAGYVKGGKSYKDSDFQLRGYKQYWLKEAERIPAKKESVAATLRPLPAGTSFSGIIRFKNLHKDELGLLLWSLRLDEGCYQSIGMGKPYGYGRMKAYVDCIKEYDAAALYSLRSLDRAFSENAGETIDEYVYAYEQYASDHFLNGEQLRSQPEIQDFLFLHREIRKNSEVSYMDLDKEEYKGLKNALETVEEIRSRAEAKTEVRQTISDLHIGDILNGKVQSKRKDGIFVDIGIGQIVLLHRSKVSHNRVIGLLKEGDLIKVKVLGINLERNTVNLSDADL